MTKDERRKFEGIESVIAAFEGRDKSFDYGCPCPPDFNTSQVKFLCKLIRKLEKELEKAKGSRSYTFYEQKQLSADERRALQAKS